MVLAYGDKSYPKGQVLPTCEIFRTNWPLPVALTVELDKRYESGEYLAYGCMGYSICEIVVWRGLAVDDY